jgi:hypothetical protein
MGFSAHAIFPSQRILNTFPLHKEENIRSSSKRGIIVDVDDRWLIYEEMCEREAIEICDDVTRHEN